MAQDNVIELVGVKCTAAANPLLGDVTVASVHVATVHEEFGSFAKFVFTVFDKDGNRLYAGNETVDGEDYQQWDGNDLDFPYKVVAERRGLTLGIQ